MSNYMRAMNEDFGDDTERVDTSHEETDKKYVIVFGNFSDGYELVGPFDSMDDADTYADTYGEDKHSWGEWVTEVIPPHKDKV